MSRIRWRIAALLDRLPSQCWTDLAMWALGWRKDSNLTWWERSPWSPIKSACRLDAQATGSCYCGKIRHGDPTS